MCVLQGKLPGQGVDGAYISFATAPRELRLEWWEQQVARSPPSWMMMTALMHIFQRQSETVTHPDRNG